MAILSLEKPQSPFRESGAIVNPGYMSRVELNLKSLFRVEPRRFSRSRRYLLYLSYWRFQKGYLLQVIKKPNNLPTKPMSSNLKSPMTSSEYKAVRN